MKIIVSEKFVKKEKSPEYKTLEKHRIPLTDEERKEVMDRGATWNHGPNGEPSPAVWKAVVDGKTWYICNTHRAYQCKSTLKGAINSYDFIETTSQNKNIQNIKIASQKVFVGNCITGLNDPVFQDYVGTDATELSQVVGDGGQITKENFLSMVLLDPTILDILNKDKNRYQYYYNQDKDIVWYYDTIKDIEYFYG